MEFERTNALVCIFILNLFLFWFVLQTLLWLLTAFKLQFLEGGFVGGGGWWFSKIWIAKKGKFYFGVSTLSLLYISCGLKRCLIIQYFIGFQYIFSFKLNRYIKERQIQYRYNTDISKKYRYNTDTLWIYSYNTDTLKSATIQIHYRLQI